MAIDAVHILKNYRKHISMIRGRKYTFNVNTLDADGVKHPFYFTTDPSGGEGFPGLITEGVNISHEMMEFPNLTGEKSSDLFYNGVGVSFNSSEDRYESTGAQAVNVPIKMLVNCKLGEYYQITVVSSFSAGSYKIYCGANSSASIISSGTSSVVLKATTTNSTHLHGEGLPVNIDLHKDFVGSISYVSVKKAAASDGVMEFIPTYTHPDTLYYMCGTHKNMGGKISIINSPGAVENPQEYYYTLGINQSNRTYPPIMKSDPKIALKFLENGLPGGLFKNVFNLPPTGTLSTDRAYSEYYNPPTGDKTVSLSGLISDPEDDTLKYRWYHYAPKTTLDGDNIETVFDNPTSLNTTATLIEPPTDMIYTLHLEISDSDNVTTLPINVKVSGTVDFEVWAVGSGIQTFDLGDSNVPFDDLD